MLRLRRDILSMDGNRAGVRDKAPRNGIQQRGFARTVGADHGDEITGGEFQGDVAKRTAFISGGREEGLRHVFDIKHEP